MDKRVCTRLYGCLDLMQSFIGCLYFKPVKNDEESKPCKEPEPWTRQRVLAEAEKCVCGGREQDYGSPEDSFQLIAKLWTAYLGVEIHPVQVSVMMALLKIARTVENPGHMDSWVDLAGYAACGGEIAGKEAKE